MGLLRGFRWLALSGRLSASSSPKGRALGKEMYFVWTAKASHFGGGGIASAMTERARPLMFMLRLLGFAQLHHYYRHSRRQHRAPQRDADEQARGLAGAAGAAAQLDTGVPLQ